MAGLVVALVGFVLGFASPAAADPFAVLGSCGAPNGTDGGQLTFAKGIGVNRSGNGAPAGSVYVAEANANHRISQFDADCNFVRTWGFDVVESGAPNDTGTGFEVCDVTAGNVAADCKQGVNGAAAGQLGNPNGVAVDQSNGFVYVTSTNNRRVDVFSGDGEFAGAFGWGVDTGAAALEVCTTASTCQQAGSAGGDAGRFGNLNVSMPEIDPDVAGRLLVPDPGNMRVAEYSTSVVGGVLSSASFVRAFGWDVVSSGPGTRTFSRSETQQVALSGVFDLGCFCIQPVSGGSFTLSFDPDGAGPSPAETTGAIPFDASAATVQQRLVDDLAAIAPGDVSVSEWAEGLPFGASEGWTVDFAGAYADTDVAQMTASGAGLTPVGSTAAVTTAVQGGEFPAFEVCQPGDGDVCKSGVAGNEVGQFPSGSPSTVAIDDAGRIYATTGPTNGNCTTAAPCRVQRFASDGTSPEVFGPTSGPGQLNFDTGTPQSVAAANVAFDPTSGDLFVQRRESTSSYRVLQFDTDGQLIDTHPAGPALPTTSNNNTGVGLAAGPDGDIYVNMGSVGAGEVFILGAVDPPGVSVDAVTDIGTTTATFSGTVDIPAPGAPTFNTTYRFEYSSNGVDWTRVPVPNADAGDGTTGAHLVSEAVEGLQPSTVYQVRLVATTGPTATSTPVVFTTEAAPPRIEWTYVEEVTRTEARLGAHIDPEGQDTSYHFEWGTQPCSNVPNPCSQIPGFERGIGASNNRVIVGEQLTGLDHEAIYHYRVIATNATSATAGPDRTFETLNDCNLTDDRCYELVSPPDKGPLGIAGEAVASQYELFLQASPSDTHPALQYVLGYGGPDSTSGEQIATVARRSEQGWSSYQLEAPTVDVPASSSQAITSRVMSMSSDLGCAAINSYQSLADDAPQASLDGGLPVMYRRVMDGPWQTVTDLVPTNGGVSLGGSLEDYIVVGMSETGPFSDCRRIVFYSQAEYSGVAGVGVWKLYLWEDGALEQVGIVPGPAGPGCPDGRCPVAAIPGASSGPTGDVSASAGRYVNVWNAVSDDGSRVAFTAVSREGGDVGRQAVFLRDVDADVAVDVSQSRTAVPNDDNSVYWTASTDGSRVFFAARSGLAANDPADGPASCTAAYTTVSNASDGTGCDLYMFDSGGDGLAGTGDDTLTDLSVTQGTNNSQGAGVFGVLGASDAGDRVYFAARGQLDPGRGPTQTRNLLDDTYSVYLWHDGEVRYVAKIAFKAGENDKRSLLSTLPSVGGPSSTTSVTRDGRHVVFESSASPTGIDTAGKREAYLYDADSDKLECVSCRRDGAPSLDAQVDSQLVSGSGSTVNAPMTRPASVSQDGRQVVFVSSDRLAAGATDGRYALYLWEDGQVTHLANKTPTTLSEISGIPRYAGMSDSGGHIYFGTDERLSWEDIDSKTDLYDAHVGGGFPQPPTPADPCDPLAGGCAGDGAGRVDPSVGTETGGDSNVVLPDRARVAVAGLSRVKQRRLAAGRRVGLVVRVNRAGRLRVRGVAAIGGLRATVFDTARNVGSAGRVRVAVRLSGPAKRRLARSGRLRLAVSVRLSGAAKPAVRVLRLTDGGKRRGTR